MSRAFEETVFAGDFPLIPWRLVWYFVYMKMQWKAALLSLQEDSHQIFT